MGFGEVSVSIIQRVLVPKLVLFGTIPVPGYNI